jgi:hypothetical protein
LEPAMDETIGHRFHNQPVPADHDRFVTRDGKLLPGRARPIAKDGSGQDSRSDPEADSAFAYGGPQCGPTGLNVSLVDCPHGKKKRLEGARVSTKRGYRKPDSGKEKRGRDRDLFSFRFPQSEIRNPRPGLGIGRAGDRLRPGHQMDDPTDKPGKRDPGQHFH